MRAARRLLVVVAAGIVIAFLLGALDVFDFLPNPFERSTVDRSQPALLEKLSDISEYRAASAELQVLLDVEKDTRFLPAVLSGERVTFLAGGSVDAAVDFGALTKRTIEVQGDAVSITLPKAHVVDVAVDPDRSYVVNRKRGLLDRVGGVFVDNPTGERELYKLAEKKLRRAADESQLLSRAQRNTKRMLVTMLTALGFTTVDIRFAEPAGT
jgi:hypothetical protein